MVAVGLGWAGVSAPTEPAAGPGRRDQILATAAALFAARGFHGVAVVDIGAACGISGPALYKHFASKQAVLAAMLVGISRRLLADGLERAGRSTDPAGALRSLVAFHVDFALEHPDLIVVQDRDWEALPDEAREEVRALQRAYVDLWAEQVRVLGGRDRDEARARAHAVFGLINSTPHSALLPRAQMAAVLRAMASSALGLPAGPG